MSIFKKIFGGSDKTGNNSSGKKPDIEKLLAYDNINKSIIELDTFICELCAWGDNLEKLTEQQKIFFYNQNLEREVNNGGFNQYLTP